MTAGLVFADDLSRTRTTMNHATAHRPLLVLAALALLAGCNQEVPIPKDPPEARKDYARTALDTPVTLAPLANDYDADDAVLTVSAIGQPAHGIAVLNPDGSVTYTPTTGYLGGDEFTVTVLDGHKNEVTESAYITVGPSERFLYRSNFVDFFTYQLYISDSAHPGVPIPASGRLPVTKGPTRPGATINNFAFSRNGKYLVYLQDEPDSPRINLYFVDLSKPGVATQLTTLVSGQAIFEFALPRISDDGEYAYYVSNEFNPDSFEAVRVETATPANKVRMNEPTGFRVVTNTDGTTSKVWGQVNRVEITPDDAHLIYVEFDPNSQGAGVGARELHVMDVATPGTSTVISGTPTTGTLGVVEGFYTVGLGFEFVPGSNRLIYPALENGSTFTDLYLVDYIAPTAPVKLSGTPVVGGVSTYRITADGTRVVYTSSEDSTTTIDLYTVALAAPGVSTRLNPLTATYRPIENYLIGGDGTYVVYLRPQDTESVNEIYKVDFATPGTSTKINHTMRVLGVGSTQESVKNMATNPGAPRTVLYSTNDSPRKLRGSFVFEQTFRTVDVDNPGVTTTIGQNIGLQFIAVLWHKAGDYLVLFDDPEFQTVYAAYETRLSDRTIWNKVTPEKFPGAQATVTGLNNYLP
jgi:Tol biopolymer transport system component